MNDKTPMLNDKTYDVLKFVAQILLPAFGTLYFSLADLWNLAKAFEVVGTITAVDLFLGTLLGLSTRSYNASDAKYDGAIDVAMQPDNKKIFTLDLNSDPDELDSKKQVIFKVNPVNDKQDGVYDER